MKPAYKAPAVLLDELGVEKPEDIRIEAIAQYCGATVVYARLDGCAARIIGRGDCAIITVDSAASRERQRFSAAHDLGHWMHDRGRIALACTDDRIARGWKEDDPERRANRYAVGVLLPERLFKPHARGVPPTFDGVRRLGAVFETSITATAVRLVENDEFPAMVVCTKAGKRVWFTRSPLVPKVLWPRETIGPGALIHRLGDGRERGPDTVDADDWIDHVTARDYVVQESSMRVTGDVVLSLLWWKDEGQILALEDEDSDDGAARWRR